MPKRNPGAKHLQMILLRICIEFLKHFARISGLHCNLEKTAVIPIGGNYNTNDKLCPS